MQRPTLLSHAVLLSCIAGALLTPVSAAALDITISDDGSILLYQDSVLGVNSENRGAPERMPEKVIPPVNKQQVRIQPSLNNSLQVEQITRQGKQERVLESQETDRLRLELPAQQTEQQRRLELAKERAQYTDTSERELERRVQQQSQLRELELSKLSPEEREKRQLFYEKQKEERQERVQEQIQLQNSLGPDGQELNLESRGIRAALRNDRVTVDPETNSLILTTRDGEQRVLTTLPDQAAERMLEVKGIANIDGDNLEVRERDGKLEYVTKAQRVKRLFGLFNRPVETELSVDDQSGEVTEVLQEKPTIIGRFLDRLAF